MVGGVRGIDAVRLGKEVGERCWEVQDGGEGLD